MDLLWLDQRLSEEICNVVGGFLLLVQVLDLLGEYLVYVLQFLHDFHVLGSLCGELEKRVGLLHFLQVDDPDVQVKALVLSFEFDDVAFTLAEGVFLEFEDIDKFVVDFDKNVHKLGEFDFFLQDNG